MSASGGTKSISPGAFFLQQGIAHADPWHDLPLLDLIDYAASKFSWNSLRSAPSLSLSSMDESMVASGMQERGSDSALVMHRVSELRLTWR